MDNIGAPEQEEREPTLEELGLHSHCLSCVLKRCNVSIEPGVSCPHIDCPFRCGAHFHQCKADDHSTLCPNVKTECLNSSLGCQAMMRRALCTSHLQRCPAHVLMCGQSIARDEFEGHFCGDHDHFCEPVLGVWKDLWQKKMEGQAEGDESASDSGGTDRPKNEETVDGKKSDKGKTSTTDNQVGAPYVRDPLHVVPWQMSRSEEEGGEGEEGEPAEEPTADASNMPMSPTTPTTPTPTTPTTPTPDEPLGLLHIPFQILQQIGMYLDRETLHELALSSHLLRQVAASLLRKKGLVETRWKKVDGKWEEDGKIWRYIPAHLKPEKT